MIMKEHIQDLTIIILASIVHLDKKAILIGSISTLLALISSGGLYCASLMCVEKLEAGMVEISFPGLAPV